MRISGMTFWADFEATEGVELNSQAISEILSVELDGGRLVVPENIKFDSSESIFYNEIAWLLDLIESNIGSLEELNVCLSDSSIWVIYEYFAQCNMEFDSDVLKRIGDLGLKLCISCYEDTNMVNRESFESSLIQETSDGVWVTNTTGKDIHLNDVFPVTVKVENNRNEKSFILCNIDFDGKLIDHIKAVDYSMSPKQIGELYDGGLSLTYDLIIKPSESVSIDIYFKAKETGIFRGTISIQEKHHYIENELIVLVEE